MHFRLRLIRGAVRSAALLTYCVALVLAREVHACVWTLHSGGEVIALVHARDSDDGQGEKPGRGIWKVAATVLALGIPVVRDFTEIVTAVLGWFTS